MDFAQALRALMDERGMSGNALAHRVHCDKALISRFVNGKQAPSAKLARLIDEGTRRSEWAAEHRRHLVSAYAQAGAPDRAVAEALEVVRVARSADSASLLGAVRRQHARLAAR
jgi:transcriptional regulator with XRE-family HTH domain